jgi:hypothetical protein
MSSELEMMAAMSKKRYKVTILEEALTNVIIWASDPEEAQQLVLHHGEGRHAGREGPNVAGVKVEEMGAGSPENAAIVDNAESEKDPNVKSLIEVVRS